MSDFSAVRALVTAGEVEGALDRLVSSSRREGRFAELFEARKLQLRSRLGLPLWSNPSPHGAGFDRQSERELEEGLLVICQEVGELLLDAGHIRDAWVYLRALHDTTWIADKLRTMKIADEQVDDVIQVAFGEGVDPSMGFALLLRHHGTCQAITTLSGYFPALSESDRRATGQLLVAHLTTELLGSLREQVRRSGQPVSSSLGVHDTLAAFPTLLAEGNPHVDVSHLSATLRMAQSVTDHNCLADAETLADYGSRLDAQWQVTGESPFTDVFGSYRLFYRALLGRDVREGIDYFRSRAESTDIATDGTLAAEVYIELLARCGQSEAAIRESRRLLPAGTPTTGNGPSLWQLCERTGDFSSLVEQTEAAGDLLGFTAALLKQGETQ